MITGPDSVTIQFAQAFFILANFAGVFLVVWYVCMLICTGAKWEARLKSKLALIFSFVYCEYQTIIVFDDNSSL